MNDKNIYQRILEVQKLVTTVDKNTTVKMSENDRGYKATTHDDVAGALHLPLAQCGVVMLPDIVSYQTNSFDKTNQYGKIVTWYRTDLEILVKWINADKPDDFFTSRGASFALDTSDKSFAKAYSLALKIVLLKVHLLESRDNEESRPFDEANGGVNGSHEAPRQQVKNEQPLAKEKKAPKIVDPGDYPMPTGSKDVKGKKLKDLPVETIHSIRTWCQSELETNPKNLDAKLLLGKVMLYINAAGLDNPPPPPPDKMPAPEDESQENPKDELVGAAEDLLKALDAHESKSIRTKENDPADFVIKLALGDDIEVLGKPLKMIPEKNIKKYLKAVEAAMLVTPRPGNLTELLEIKGQIGQFLRSMEIK